MNPKQAVGADRELLTVFLDEAGEALAGAYDRLMVLDRGIDLAAIEDAFRPIHSVKGNCAFFGLMATKSLAHELENVLDHLRKRRLIAAPPLVSLLLTTVDELRAMLVDARATSAETGSGKNLEHAHLANAASLREQLRAAAGEARLESGADLGHAIAIVEEHVIRSGGGTPIVRQALTTLIEQVRGGVGDLRSDHHHSAPARVAPALEHPNLAAVRTWTAQALIESPTADQLDAGRALIAALTAALAVDPHCPPAATAMANELLESWDLTVGAAGFSDVIRDWLVAEIEKLGAMLPATEPSSHADQGGMYQSGLDPVPALTAPSASAPSGPPALEPETVIKTMRVAEARIDTFLRLVGELVVVGDVLDHLNRRIRALPGAGAIAKDFRRGIETFSGLSTQLQTAIMAIRKVPIRPLLHKAPRLVREVATALGKPITCTISGEAVEIDKRLLDLLDVPLVHVVRNACDHGIEAAVVRRAAGKPQSGTITVSASETATTVLVTISDDGGGLDLDRIRATGVALGLIPAGARLSESELINLIFASGVTTKATISDISGRGVGLDAVKRAMEQAGGTIAVSTVTGEGTTFTITLPKRATTQIIGGYVVRCCGQAFVLPLERVRETFAASSASVTRLAGRTPVASKIPGAITSRAASTAAAEPKQEINPSAHVVIRHGRAIPVVALSPLLGLGDEIARAMVVVEIHHRHVAIAVGEVVGLQKVVVRPLTGLPAADFLLGAALMGDGSAALIIAPDALPELTDRAAHLTSTTFTAGAMHVHV